MGSFIIVLALAFVTFVSGAIANQGSSSVNVFFAIVCVVSGVAVYFAPTWVAAMRDHSSRVAIIVLNVLLGWTVLGWVVALVWAYAGRQAASATPHMPAAPPSPLFRHELSPAPAGATTTVAAQEKSCPFCAETIKAAAIKCKHCGSDLQQAAQGAAAS